MSYWHGRRVPAAEPEPDRPSAVYGVLVAGEDFANQPFGGHAGEALPRPEPAPPPPQPLAIEPPEWSGPGDVVIVQPDPPAPVDGLTALDVMKIQAGDIEELPPPPLEPPMVTPPLVRPQLPEPDWRREEAEQAARDREPVGEPAKSLQGRPA